MKSKFLTCISAVMFFAAIYLPESSISARAQTKSDVSPDAPFGTRLSDNGNAPSGRVITILVDPSNEYVLYAASEWAGVWKSADAGHTWQQSSNGLRSGITQLASGPMLALDSNNPTRLLYATQDNDGRPKTKLPTGEISQFGGLWISTNGAMTWQHVKLLGFNCYDQSISSVVFAASTAYVATACGIFANSGANLSDALSWSRLQDVPSDLTFPYLVGQPNNNTLFACQGSNLYRVVNPNLPSAVWQPASLGAGCFAVAAVPSAPGTLATAALAVVQTPSGSATGNEVLQVNFTPTSFTTLNLGIFSTTTASGNFGVWAPALGGPGGGGFDVYAADTKYFYHRRANGQWQQLSGLHTDTWWMAFPPSYNPPGGVCTAYAASDGGVSVNLVSIVLPPGGGQAVCQSTGAENYWAGANSGLHLIFSIIMTGFSQPTSFHCVLAHQGDGQPCPVLFLPSADDDTWVTAAGGFPNTSWQDFGDQLGDSGEVFIDPALPNVALAVRNNNYHMFVGPAGEPPPSGTSWFDITPTNGWIGIQPPGAGGITQVMTLPNETPLPFGDYLAIESLFEQTAFGQGCTPSNTCGNDIVVRNVKGASPQVGKGGWLDISPAPGLDFGPGQVGAIAASGGHTNTTVYVLTSNNPNTNYQGSGRQGGQIWKGQADSTGFIPKWLPASGTSPLNVTRAYNLIVNPYDPNEVYVTDLGDLNGRTIKVSRDGGQTWQAIPALKDIATNHGEFLFSCGAFAWGPDNFQDKQIFGNQCPLTQMVFVRDLPEIRVAVLYPGGIALSQDGGMSWTPLNATNEQPSEQPIELPHSAFYDPRPNARNGQPSIYVGLEGKGVIRIEGQFQALGGPPAPTNCSVTIVTCGHEATLVCDPVPLRNSLVLAQRNLQPPPPFNGVGFTPPTLPDGANEVYDAPIEQGNYEFEACDVDPSFVRSCFFPVPYVGPDPTGCGGGGGQGGGGHHPPPPPKKCIEAGCTPRPGGGCICE